MPPSEDILSYSTDPLLFSLTAKWDQVTLLLLEDPEFSLGTSEYLIANASPVLLSIVFALIQYSESLLPTVDKQLSSLITESHQEANREK